MILLLVSTTYLTQHLSIITLVQVTTQAVIPMVSMQRRRFSFEFRYDTGTCLLTLRILDQRVRSHHGMCTHRRASFWTLILYLEQGMGSPNYLAMRTAAGLS